MSKLMHIVIAVVAIALIATPVFAAESSFSVYGSARVASFYKDYDQADDQDFTIDKQGNSRFGMKGSLGTVSGHVELGLDSSVYTRLIYGTYKFDAGSLTIGQDYMPYNFFSYNAAFDDEGFIGYGATYEGRQPQIRLNLNSGFYLAAIKNAGQGSANDTTIPKLAVGYAGKAGIFAYGLNLAYQTYEVEATGADMDSYLATFNGVVDLNPVAVQFNLAYGQNPSEFGLVGSQLVYSGYTQHLAATADEDTAYLAGYVQLAVKANDSNTIRMGVAYAQEDNDAYAETETRMAYFIHDQFNIAPGFFVVPEIAYYDGMDDGDGSDGEDCLAIGAKWQVNF